MLHASYVYIMALTDLYRIEMGMSIFVTTLNKYLMYLQSFLLETICILRLVIQIY